MKLEYFRRANVFLKRIFCLVCKPESEQPHCFPRRAVCFYHLLETEFTNASNTARSMMLHLRRSMRWEGNSLESSS